MVGSLLLLKMLHCKRMSSRRKNKSESQSTSGKPKNDTKSLKKIVVKKENENVCRVCLNEGSIPIYGNDMNENVSEALSTFGGINIKLDDPYPKYLCHLCNSLLRGAILFRKTAQQSDKLLKPSKTETLHEENDSEGCADDNIIVNHQELQVEVQEITPAETYWCRRCNIEFNTIKELDDHKLSDEHENFKVICQYCYKAYDPRYYKRHLSIHVGTPAFVCDICGKKFALQGHFTKHRQIHFYDLPFKCSLCPYRGRFTESLKMHMRSHTGERPYQCTECPSRFISKSNLNKHALTHKEERDFQCDTCGRGFHLKRALEQHYKVNHAGIKDHVCRVCGKEFGLRKQMMKHELKVHKRAKLRSGKVPLYLRVESMQQQDQDIVTAES